MGTSRSVRGAFPLGTRLRSFCLLTASILCIQFAWICAIPAFFGLDEVDHSYRAAEIYAGELRLDHPSAGTWAGEQVIVPAALAEAAGHVCLEQWREQIPEKCQVTAGPAPGLVTATSSAARYNPAFYAVVGWPTVIVDGVAALYAMRILAALCCALLVAWAITVSARTARTRWPAVAILVAMTPTWWYSTTVMAPNGVEMAAGLLLGSSLLCMARWPGELPLPRSVIAAASAGAVIVATVRSFGPIWLVLILAMLTLAYPGLRQRLRARARAHSPAVVLVAAAILAGLGWSLISGTNQVPAGPEVVAPWVPVDQPALSATLIAVIIAFWALQAIAAFPDLTMFAPWPVYVLVAGLLTVLGAGALRLASRSQRWAVLGGVAALTALAMAATVTTYADLGVVWQGRYGLPVAVVLVLMLGAVLDAQRACPTWLMALTTASLLITTVLSLTRIDRRDLAANLTDLPIIDVGPAITSTLAILGTSGLVATMLLSRPLRPAGHSRPGTDRPDLATEAQESTV
jgi:hypothetical protein